MVFANPYIVVLLYAIAIGMHLFWSYFQGGCFWAAAKWKLILPNDYNSRSWRPTGFYSGVASGRGLI